MYTLPILTHFPMLDMQVVSNSSATTGKSRKSILTQSLNFFYCVQLFTKAKYTEEE